MQGSGVHPALKRAPRAVPDPALQQYLCSKTSLSFQKILHSLAEPAALHRLHSAVDGASRNHAGHALKNSGSFQSSSSIKCLRTLHSVALVKGSQESSMELRVRREGALLQCCHTQVAPLPPPHGHPLMLILSLIVSSLFPDCGPFQMKWS